MATMTVNEGEGKLREALERVQKGEDVTITEDGKVIAVLIHPAKLRASARAEALKEAEGLADKLRAARNAPFELTGSDSLEDVEAHIREIREGRNYDVWERVEAELVGHSSCT